MAKHNQSSCYWRASPLRKFGLSIFLAISFPQIGVSFTMVICQKTNPGPCTSIAAMPTTRKRAQRCANFSHAALHFSRAPARDVWLMNGEPWEWLMLMFCSWCLMVVHHGLWRLTSWWWLIRIIGMIVIRSDPLYIRCQQPAVGG